MCYQQAIIVSYLKQLYTKQKQQFYIEARAKLA